MTYNLLSGTLNLTQLNLFFASAGVYDNVHSGSYYSYELF